ncbi:MAG TPA: metal ABC transporter permease, partial [Burkholderiales bacterium]|nr:metal ABC transporter permease [Burkholderiales bacterium]
MNSGDWKTVRTLLPYLMEFRGRVSLAALFLILAKAAGVTVPIVFKHVVDSLDGRKGAIFLPVALLLIYGVLRFFNT